MMRASWIMAAAGALALGACAQPEARIGTAPPPAAPAVAGVPKNFQFMGSAEAAALSRQAWQALARHVAAAAAARPRDSVVLAEGATPDAPRFVPCGNKPLAIVIDMDETTILNSGANYDSARRGDPPFNAARWEAWEREGARYVEPVPGALEGLAQVRAAGVTPIFISNRINTRAAGAADALRAAGLGEARHLETMFLREDVAPGSGKDPRRTAVAARWCVVAMGGDQLGDFSDAFNAKALSVPARRALAQAPAIRALWGQGWFLIPNTLYGPSIAGTIEDLFPADMRWPGPAETEKP